MPDILYVSLLDMHLGEEDSLLTHVEADGTQTEPTQPSPVMWQLVVCLRDLVSKNENAGKPTLILNGDILELALTTTNEAATVFERFMEFVMPRNRELFERIVYIRTHVDHVLSEGVRNGLVEYMNGPLKKQVLAENGRMLREMTFVFGHTHKPYQERLEADRNSEWKAVYNTGGWVVETVRREPIHGGAVVLVDENLNLTSLRMYNESEDPGSYVVEVAEAGGRENSFHERIVKLVKERRKPFREFSKIVVREVDGRAQMLKSRSEKGK